MTKCSFTFSVLVGDLICKVLNYPPKPQNREYHLKYLNTYKLAKKKKVTLVGTISHIEKQVDIFKKMI